MDPRNCKIFTSFSITPQNCEILTSFYPPHKLDGNIVSFAHRTNLAKTSQLFLTAQNWQKFYKFFSPTNLRIFYKFLSRHKLRKCLLVFVPPAKLRDKIFLPQKYTARFVTRGGGVRPVTKRYARFVTGGGSIPPWEYVHFSILPNIVSYPDSDDDEEEVIDMKKIAQDVSRVSRGSTNADCDQILSLSQNNKQEQPSAKDVSDPFGFAPTSIVFLKCLPPPPPPVLTCFCFCYPYSKSFQVK